MLQVASQRGAEMPEMIEAVAIAPKPAVNRDRARVRSSASWRPQVSELHFAFAVRDPDIGGRRHTVKNRLAHHALARTASLS